MTKVLQHTATMEILPEDNNYSDSERTALAELRALLKGKN